MDFQVVAGEYTASRRETIKPFLPVEEALYELAMRLADGRLPIGDSIECTGDDTGEVSDSELPVTRYVDFVARRTQGGMQYELFTTKIAELGPLTSAWWQTPGRTLTDEEMFHGQVRFVEKAAYVIDVIAGEAIIEQVVDQAQLTVNDHVLTGHDMNDHGRLLQGLLAEDGIVFHDDNEEIGLEEDRHRKAIMQAINCLRSQ